jgi:hypothetical protein
MSTFCEDFVLSPFDNKYRNLKNIVYLSEYLEYEGIKHF